MLASPQSARVLNGTESTTNAALIREQLRRLLAHPLFTNSKRYPVLLAYTVEQVLNGNASELKERTIGVEAFGRAPHYDVNLDPVVRTTAAEVRKRLIQYYYNPEHAWELVIELPVGSYVPSFREPASDRTAQAIPVVQPNETSPKLGPQVPFTDTGQKTSGFITRHWIAMALLAAALIGFGAGRMKLPNQRSNLERFWEPIASTSNRITYCLGMPADTIDHERLPPPGTTLYGGLDVSDVTTLARSIVPLVPRHQAFRVLAASNASFTQLREGPVVLIGAFDNPWTMRIMQDLPFGFEYNHDEPRIVDRKSTMKRFWTLQWQMPQKKLARDYAIVARIHDTVTGQPVMILAGILGEGTEAASEIVSSPEYLNTMLEKAPKTWERMNLEAVIETHVIEGHPGPPKVLVVEAW